jgi:RHS repeat-associated protein
MQRIRITDLGAGNTPRYQTTALETMHGDYLGTCSAVTDWSGAVVWESTSDAWGAHATATGTAANDRGYAATSGYERNGSGLLDVGIRAYDPELGQFLQQDPQGDGYRYCASSPPNAVGPSGELASDLTYTCWSVRKHQVGPALPGYVGMGKARVLRLITHFNLRYHRLAQAPADAWRYVDNMVGIYVGRSAPKITCTAQSDPEENYDVPVGWMEVAQIGRWLRARIEYSQPLLGGLYLPIGMLKE